MAESKPKEIEGQIFNFTRDGVVIIAKSLEDAQKTFENRLKESKESDNG